MGPGRESAVWRMSPAEDFGPPAPGAESIGAGGFSVFPGRMGIRERGFHGFKVLRVFHFLFCLVIAFFMVRRMTERGGLGRLILYSIVAVFGAVCLTVVLVS